MTNYRTRTDITSPLPTNHATRILDWAPGKAEATIQASESGADFFSGWRAPREAADLMLFGATAYCVDKTCRRDTSADAWTRTLEVDLPVSDIATWKSADWEGTLNFLTGDRWRVTPYTEQRHPLDAVSDVPSKVTPVGTGIGAICLFSGGLDSLTGIVEILESDPDVKLCLLSHHEGGQASTAQQALFKALTDHYGHERLTSRRLFLRPAPANSSQARPLPRGRENTTRARSLLFLTSALSLAASIGPDVPVYIPENGFIGINVPLTRSRFGSFSTRTTHPYFMARLGTAAKAIGVGNPISNPYRLSTKGEMLASTKNPELLRALAPLSLSCSHPEAARYVQRKQGNCGYCFPCLIRRASMAMVGWDSATGYAWDALSEGALLDPHTRRGADLRAVVSGVFAERPDREILRNGPIPASEHADFIRVWRTGIEELRNWLQGASGRLAAALKEVQ